jgi:zinc protease
MRRFLLSLTLAAVVSAPARAKPPAAAPGVAPLSFTSFQLDNGLRVILHENKRTRKVLVKVWYEVGSRDEKAGFHGFAHLMEHVAAMNNPTAHMSLEEQKATEVSAGGSNNASTSFDRTDYYIEGDHRYLERFLRLMADQMGFLNGSISADVYREETKHVVEELKLRSNVPGGGVMKQLLSSVYPPDHPYAHAPIGSREDLYARNADDARAFHNKYYWPNNAILVISGNLDAQETKAMAAKWFGTLARGPEIPRPAVPKGPSPVARATHLDPMARNESLLMAWRIPGKGQPGFAELALFADLFGGSSTSRLNEELVIKRQLFTEVKASLFGLQLGGLFLVEATPVEGVTLEQSEQAVMAELDKMLKSKIDARRLQAIARGNRLGALVASQSGATVSALMAESLAYTGKVDPFYFLNDAAQAARNPARVGGVARQYLKKPDTVMTIRPKREVPAP